MPGDLLEVTVRREHRQVVANAELSQQSIDRSDLCAGTTAKVLQLRGLTVIIAIGNK